MPHSSSFDKSLFTVTGGVMEGHDSADRFTENEE
jgi:hypothetical protein